MKSIVDVRMARPKDEDGVLRLAKAFATSFEVAEEAFRDSYRAALGHQGAKLLVAEREGAIVGYLLGFIHPTFYANGPVAWVEEVMVDAAARREGIGSHLLARFEQWACEHGAHLVALATRRAAAFYEAAGYSDSAIYFRKLL